MVLNQVNVTLIEEIKGGQLMEIISKSARPYSFPTKSGIVSLPTGGSLVLSSEQYQELNQSEGFKSLISQKEIVLGQSEETEPSKGNDSISGVTPEGIPENSDSVPKRTKG